MKTLQKYLQCTTGIEILPNTCIFQWHNNGHIDLECHKLVVFGAKVLPFLSALVFIQSLIYFVDENMISFNIL